MNTFVLHLAGATQYERIESVASFVAEDRSGQFGVMAGHARMLACLSFGLARFRVADGPWQYLALPGAVLYFRDNELHLLTRRYLRDADYGRIALALQQQILSEEKALGGLKKSIRRMEQEMFKRLWELARHQEPLP